MLAVSACSSYKRPDSPLLFYPLGMTQAANNLAFISSNADGRFASGKLVFIDAKAAADKLRSQYSNENKRSTVTIKDYVLSQTDVPTLSFSPQIVQSRLWLAHRLNDEALSFPLTQQGTLACNPAAVQQDCSSQQARVLLNADDPVKLIALQNDTSQVVMAAVFDHSHKIQTFSYTPQEPQKVTAAQPIALKSFLEPIEKKKKLSKRIKDPVFVARDITQLGRGNDGRLAVVLETFPQGGGAQFYSPYLLLLPTKNILENQPLQTSDGEVVDLNALTGAFSVRAVVALPDSNTLFVVMHKPDMLVRIDLNPARVVAASNTTCIYPIQLQLDTAKNLYLTCYKGDSVQQYNPQTLQVQQSQYLPGIGPAAAVIDEQAGYLYVSSLLNDSIAVLSLQDFTWLGSVISQQQVDRQGRKR